MISFRVKDAQAAKCTLEKVQLISFAESLGGVETLLTYPTMQTHGDVPTEVKKSGLALRMISCGCRSASRTWMT